MDGWGAGKEEVCVWMGFDDNVEMENWREEGENVEAEIGKSKQGTS